MRACWHDEIEPKARELTHRIVDSAKLFRSLGLQLLAEQLRQAECRVAAGHSQTQGQSPNSELAEYFKIARDCVTEYGYQLLLAREGALPERRPYEPLHREVMEIRKELAGILRLSRRHIRLTR